MTKRILKYFSFICILLLVLLFSINSFNYFKITQQENKNQFGKTVTRPENLLWGEPVKTMFPDITEPEYVASNKTVFLTDTDDVYVYNAKKGTYVYPASILSFHHIINDKIEGKNVAITLCLLSDNALVYSRNLNNTVLTFGVLGPLYLGNLVMYDKQTDSYWLQLSGEAVKGSYKQKRLEQISVLEKAKWKDVKDGNVFVLPPVNSIEFYANFYKRFETSTIGLNSLTQKKVKIDTRIPNFTKGLGIFVQNKAAFYPLEVIKKEKIINDEVGGWSILVVNNGNNYKIFRRFIDNKQLTFKFNESFLEDTETHSKWNFDGYATEGSLKGKQLSTPVYTQVFWFSWSAFYPQTVLGK